MGSAAEEFGLKQGVAITHKQFLDLQENRHPVSGKRLTRRHNTVRKEWQMRNGKLVQVTVANRRKFIDFSINCPKSFSVLALVGEDPRPLMWHNEAVNRVIEEMEKFTSCFDKRDGGKKLEVTGKFCAVKTAHYTNRSNEPNAHHHLCVFSATPSGNGKGNYAINAEYLYERIPYFTAVYRNSMAASAVAGWV